MLAGLAWYYRDSWVLAPVLLAMIGTSVVPYVRARGEGLGVQVRDGLMQRAERVMYLGAATVLSPVFEAIFDPGRPPPHALAGRGGALRPGDHQQLHRRWCACSRWCGRSARRPALPPPPARPLLGRLGLNVAAAVLATGVDFAVALSLRPRRAGPLRGHRRRAARWGRWSTSASTAPSPSAATARPLAQAGRYALVSLTSLGLNAGGVSVLLSHPALPYPAGLVVVRLAVFLLWNYPLHAGYVFGDRAEDAGHAA